MAIDPIIGSASIELLKLLDNQGAKSGLENVLFPYRDITKKAVDIYISEIEKMDISPEEKVFLILRAKKTIKKIKNQKSIADIAIENAKDGTDFSNESGVREEWIERFMDSAGYVSEKEMQIIWGKILANEFENPGKTPPNMIRILSEMTSQMAKAFCSICNMNIILFSVDSKGEITRAAEKVLVPFENNTTFMVENYVTFDILNELESQGLITFDSLFGFLTDVHFENQEKNYFSVKEKVFRIESCQGNGLPIGSVLLTKSGECLKQVVEKKQLKDYDKEVEQCFQKNKVEYEFSGDYEIQMGQDEKKYIKKVYE